MKAGLLGMLLLTLVTTATPSQAQLDELIARAKSFELNTPYVPPPGEPLAHHAAGYAKVMCSAVFMTGLAPGFCCPERWIFHCAVRGARKARFAGDRPRQPSGSRHAAERNDSNGKIRW